MVLLSSSIFGCIACCDMHHDDGRTGKLRAALVRSTQAAFRLHSNCKISGMQFGLPTISLTCELTACINNNCMELHFNAILR